MRINRYLFHQQCSNKNRQMYRKLTNSEMAEGQQTDRNVQERFLLFILQQKSKVEKNMGQSRDILLDHKYPPPLLFFFISTPFLTLQGKSNLIRQGYQRNMDIQRNNFSTFFLPLRGALNLRRPILTPAGQGKPNLPKPNLT